MENQPIFIGFKLETAMARELDALEGPDRRYVSADNSDFLRICLLGEKRYVGKLIHERMTTERIDDICRNISSILNRLLPEMRLPKKFEILACSDGEAITVPSEGQNW
jgi:hypothetical protein